MYSFYPVYKNLTFLSAVKKNETLKVLKWLSTKSPKENYQYPKLCKAIKISIFQKRIYRLKSKLCIAVNIIIQEHTKP